MNKIMKQILGRVIIGLISLSLVGCNNNDSEVKALQKQITKLEQQIEESETKDKKETLTKKDTKEENNKEKETKEAWTCPVCLHSSCPKTGCLNMKECFQCGCYDYNSEFCKVDETKYACNRCAPTLEYCEWCSNFGSVNGLYGKKLILWWDSSNVAHYSCENGNCTKQLEDLYIEKCSMCSKPLNAEGVCVPCAQAATAARTCPVPGCGGDFDFCDCPSELQEQYR